MSRLLFEVSVLDRGGGGLLGGSFRALLNEGVRRRVLFLGPEIPMVLLYGPLCVKVDSLYVGMSLSELARGMGVAPARITEWKRRGMPVGSLEGARAWRAIHAPARAKERAKVETVSWPKEGVRWSVRMAAVEFGISDRTLVQRLRADDSNPGEDGRYSTRQVARAIFCDKEIEQTRKIREEADLIAKKNAEWDRRYVAVDRVRKMGEGFVVAVRQKILASHFTPEEKDEILHDLASLAGTKWEECADVSV